MKIKRSVSILKHEESPESLKLKIDKENLVNQLQSQILKSQNDWLHFKLQELFSPDPDLYWMYEYFKKESDSESLIKLFAVQGLRIVRQSGKMVRGAFLIHLYKNHELIGTHEINLNKSWAESW